MNSEIIAVGSELLLGQIANTNAQFLSKQLAQLGINVFFHTVVGDNPHRLKSAIEIAEKRSNLIIFTGGLGPTKDDLTKETIASHLGKKLVEDEDSLKRIEAYFQNRNVSMPENNKKQALIIEDSYVFPNDHGTAPGMAVKTNDHLYMLFPGPPRELQPMFFNYGMKVLQGIPNNNGQIVSKVLRFYGIGESLLETKIQDLIEKQTNPTIAPLASDGEVTLRLTAKHPSVEKANEFIQEVEDEILSRVGKYFYGYNSTSLMNELFQEMKKQKLTIACAESLTGGMFQQELTAIPGSSSVLKGGVVCYATEIKEHILQVKKETIVKKGVVSSECATEMAENVRNLFAADVGISFTGVAGPAEQEGKPVGTVFVGISLAGKETYVKPLQLVGSRDIIRIKAVKEGAFRLLKMLKKNG